MSIWHWLTSWIPRRDNEFDTAEPGPRRAPTGLFDQLDEEQKKALDTYEGPEVSGYHPKAFAADDEDTEEVQPRRRASL